MTSQERHERRYQRRKAKRDYRRYMRSKSHGDFEQVFSYENLYKAGKNSCKGVMWKNSTQAYLSNICSNTYTTHKRLMEGKFKSKGFHEFDIIERGKPRHIRSIHISERAVQKALCDEILTDVFTVSFIYDNAASLKNKGVDFAMNRLNCHLQRHYRKHGLTGSVLLCDFSSYFDNARHDIIYRENERRIHDERIRKIANGFMEDFGEIGFGLGSQVSQIDALMLASPLDHFIKEQLHIKYYGRYMDDFYLIHHDMDYLKYCKREIEKKCNEMGLILSKKKTRILPLRQGFRFLKTKFILTDTGKVIRRMSRKSSQAMHRKLKKFKKWVDEGTFTLEDVRTSYESWNGHMKRGNSYHALKRMDKYYNKLFGDRRSM